MNFGSNLAYSEIRREGREDVYYRARAFGPDARQLNFVIVNISPHGLMARCDDPVETGDRIRVVLPHAGTVVAEVRWALGGRIGCQFERAIDLASYYELISLMVKAK
ncbi:MULTISPECIES: PilZ domain-containing protein [unclassified Sphingomonas]|uniref:PilZ domain-containing protein n=1 Tax=unclassified Sphingomonas TaxID=196159 RepID=UPI000AB13C8B|nr:MULTISPECIES: PilZ domain-containing protein [unclassified Sphingomonas]